MPHQCIICGNLIPSGDQQILQGCSRCGGKKFYFTATALSEDERAQVKERADHDIDELLNDVFQQEEELTEALEEGGLMEEEWVKVTPAPVEGEGGVIIESPQSREREADGGREEGAAEPRATPAPRAHPLGDGPEARAQKPVRVAVSKKQPLEAGPAGGPGDGADPGRSGQPAGRQAVGQPDGKIKGLKPRLKPEVVHMIEPGVYEIDLERLLDKSPIIINQDGTYLIHLPSVFTASGGKKKRS